MNTHEELHLFEIKIVENISYGYTVINLAESKIIEKLRVARHFCQIILPLQTFELLSDIDKLIERDDVI